MIKLVDIQDSIANKISYYHLVLFLLSLPFNRFYTHIVLISLLIHTLIHLKKKDIKPVLTLQNWILSSMFFVTLIATIYSSNKHDAYQEVGKQSSILIMPLLFCLNPIDLTKYKNKLFLIFSLGCTLAVMYLYVQAIITINYYHLRSTALFSEAFTNHNFSEPFAIHATYLSMQLSLALIYLLSIIIKQKLKKYRILLLICCIILTAGIIQLSSKSILFALLLLFHLSIPYFLYLGKARLKFMFIALPVSLLLFVGIYKIDVLRTRYLTTLKDDLSISSNSNLSDPRLARWQVAVAVALEKPFVGHGAGTETKLLRERYFDKKFYRSYLASLNAHNEFLSLWIKAGIWGLSIYLITLFFGLKTSLVKKDLLLFSFIVLVAIISFSENILDVDKGILFYSFFFSLLYFSRKESQKKNEILFL